MPAPEGAQLSEDGSYWWDGAESQPVDAGGGETAPEAEIGQLSEDGQWLWDGSGWQAVEGAGSGSGLAEALASQGIAVDASVDAGTIQATARYVEQWYGGLDSVSQTIIDTVSQYGYDQVLGDPEMGVVSEGDPLIAAFASNEMTLGQSLEATNQALQQSA